MKLVKVDVAAGILGIHRKTLYRWIREGQVKAYRIGRCIRIDEEELIGGLKNV